MKITDIRATTVTVPLEAPLRHANGCHWGRFVRTIVEVETDEGPDRPRRDGRRRRIGRGVFRAMKPYLVGHDPARLEEMRFMIANPTGVALQQPHAGPGGARVRLPRHPRAEVGRAGLRHSRRQVARSRAVRVVPVLPLSPNAKDGRAKCARSSSSSRTRAS